MENVAYQSSGNAPARRSVKCRRLKFRSLNLKNTDLNNLICSRDTEFGIEVGRSEGYIEFKPESKILYSGDSISFKLNGFSGKLFFSSALVNLLLSDLNLKLPFYEMPVEMQRAVLNASITRIIKSVSQASKALHLEIEHYTLNEKQGKSEQKKSQLTENYELKLSIAISSNGQSVNCGLAFEEAAYEYLRDFFVSCDKPELTPSNFIEVPINLSVLAGWQSLTASELSSLRKNDVVIVETPEFGKYVLSASNNFNYLVESDSESAKQLASQRVHAHVFKVVKEIEGKLMEEHALNQDQPNDGDPASRSEPQEGGQAAEAVYGGDYDSPAGGGPDSSKIPVNLVFELGRKAMPFQEVQYLELGYTFDLGIDPKNTVDILANGVKIGRGEIVEIAGRLGVRVVELKE